MPAPARDRAGSCLRLHLVRVPGLGISYQDLSFVGLLCLACSDRCS